MVGCVALARSGRSPIDGLTIYGFASVTGMMVFYALEPRSRHFTLAFAGACLAASIYGLLAGTWPFAVVEAVWSGVAVVRWLRHATTNRR